MKSISKSVFAAVGLASLSAGAACAEKPKAQADIVELLSAYEKALNGSDVEASVSLYDDEGVFMPPNSPSQVGIQNIRSAYQAVFNAIKLDVDFEIIEIVQVSEDWAFARTNSKGETTINATGDKIPEGNQELFIFQKNSEGVWKIARYAFSTTNPLQN